LGVDPGFRTGVKVAVVDATGKVVATSVIYPREPQRRWYEALAILGKLAKTAQSRTDLDWQWHRVARDRQTCHRAGQAAARLEDVEDCRLLSSRIHAGW
jgi:transcriptional accessory protein Tex/SPT6